MEKIEEKVAETVEKVEEKAEEKLAELIGKVDSKVIEFADVALDKADVVVAETTEKVSSEIMNAVESNVVVQKIEALIDSNPQLKAAVDKLEDELVKQVDGRMFTCWCFGWWLSLKITRQNPKSLPATPSPSTCTPPPPPSTQVPEWPQSKTPDASS